MLGSIVTSLVATDSLFTRLFCILISSNPSSLTSTMSSSSSIPNGFAGDMCQSPRSSSPIVMLNIPTPPLPFQPGIIYYSPPFFSSSSTLPVQGFISCLLLEGTSTAFNSFSFSSSLLIYSTSSINSESLHTSKTILKGALALVSKT